VLATVAAAAPSGGALLAGALWRIDVQLTVVNDSFTPGALSARGYELTRSALTLARPPLQGAAYNFLLIQPLAAAVNFTIAFPLADTFVSVRLSQMVPVTQLLSNVVGLLGLMSVFGAAFTMFEVNRGGLAMCRRAKTTAATGAAGGSQDSRGRPAAQINHAWVHRPAPVAAVVEQPQQGRAPPKPLPAELVRDGRSPFTGPTIISRERVREGGTFERANPHFGQERGRLGAPPIGTRSPPHREIHFS
jgi:hypothetical protein